MHNLYTENWIRTNEYFIGQVKYQHNETKEIYEDKFWFIYERQYLAQSNIHDNEFLLGVDGFETLSKLPKAVWCAIQESKNAIKEDYESYFSNVKRSNLPVSKVYAVLPYDNEIKFEVGYYNITTQQKIRIYVTLLFDWKTKKLVSYGDSDVYVLKDGIETYFKTFKTDVDPDEFKDYNTITGIRHIDSHIIWICEELDKLEEFKLKKNNKTQDTKNY